MKFLIVHGYGMADVPSSALGGKTPLEAADTPALDRLSGSGELGAATMPSDALGLKGEASPLVVLGYDPGKLYGGPAPFEAAGVGVALDPHDVAFRCYLTTLGATPHEGPTPPRAEVRKLTSHLTMEDATAGGIDTETARELLDAVNEQLGSETIQFYPGQGHRHFMVWASGKFRAVCHPPHEVAGKPIGDFLPAGDGADVLRQAMESAFVILRDHPVNEERRKEGLKPANGLWLWGQGKAVKMAKLTEPRGLTGAVVAGSDLARGVGMAAGLEPVELSSPTMTVGLDLGAYRDAALRELRKHDIVYVQVGLTDPEHADTGAKVALTSDFDRLLVSPLIETLATLGPHRVVVLCDYGMRLKPIELPVPYILFEGPVKSAAPSRPFHEASAAAAGKPRDAAKLMPRLLTKG